MSIKIGFEVIIQNIEIVDSEIPERASKFSLKRVDAMVLSGP